MYTIYDLLAGKFPVDFPFAQGIISDLIQTEKQALDINSIYKGYNTAIKAYAPNVMPY